MQDTLECAYILRSFKNFEMESLSLRTFTSDLDNTVKTNSLQRLKKILQTAPFILLLHTVLITDRHV